MDGKTEVRNVDLKDMKFGHELPKGGINDRVSDREVDVDRLAANINEVGLLQPVVLWRNGTSGEGKPPYYVLAGNRRLAALRKLKKGGCAAVMIDAMDVNEALNLAASSNLHVPLHPVDCYETFSRLQAGGMADKAIATTFGLPVKEVERMLALGALAPEIRKAWRDGKLAPELARAFTLEPDQKRQTDIYEKLKKGHNLYLHHIRSAILGDNSKSVGMLKLVGRAAYEKAGGTFRVDLFADSDRRQDPMPLDLPLLKKLTDAKMTAEVNRLKKAGWKWVELEDDLPSRVRWQWPTHDDVDEAGPADRPEKTPAAVKAQSGCIVGVDEDGFDIAYGIIRPKDAKAVTKASAAAEPAAPDKPKKAKADPKALSGALAARLDTQVALAVQDVLHAAYAGNLGHAACIMLASLITPERLSWSSVKIEDVRYLRDCEVPKVMVPALLKRFDVKGYFSGIPTALIKKLLETELFTKDGIAKMGKTQLVDLAVKQAAAHKWLPLQMRQAQPKPTKKKARRK